MTAVLPARITARYAAPEVFVTVDDPTGEVRVRWRMGRELAWRCDACGPQATTACAHTFAAGLLLAETFLGLTRLPEFNPNREATR